MSRHADAAAQPPVRNVRTQPGGNGMSAGEALHLPIHPQRQQQPRVHRRTTRVMATGADGALEVRHVQRFDSRPYGANRMTAVNQLLVGPSRQYLSPFRPEHTHSRPSAPRHGESCSHCGAYASMGCIRYVNFFSRPQLGGAAEEPEERRHDQHVEGRRGRRPPRITTPIGAWISLPGSPARTAAISASPAERRHQDGASRSSEPAPPPRGRPPLRHQVLEVGDHHDAVARGDAEQRDEADERGDAQHAARRAHTRDHAADERERQVDHA